MTEYDWSKYINIFPPLFSFLWKKRKKKKKETLLCLLREQGEQQNRARGTELTDSPILLCPLSAVLSL